MIDLTYISAAYAATGVLLLALIIATLVRARRIRKQIHPPHEA